MEDMGFTINQRYRVEERRFRLKFKPEYHKKRLKDLDTELHDMFQRENIMTVTGYISTLSMIFYIGLW